MEEALAYQNGFATGFSAGYARARELPNVCNIGTVNIPPALSSNLATSSKTVEWGINNVEYSDYRFQYGVDYWMHTFLARRAHAHADVKLQFVPIYFSFIHIFYPHLKTRALRKISRLYAPRNLIVPHTHPGSCHFSTRSMIRLVVDTDLCPSTRFISVPYVVSHPAWLVADRLPPTKRSLLLYFRGHLPKKYIDVHQVRSRILHAFKTQPDVDISAATSTDTASYAEHNTYLQKLLTSVFCLAPRGDTASSKRIYESIAAGCIPVIISDNLKLPFERQLEWNNIAVRFTEDEAIRTPLHILHTLRNMSNARIAEIRKYTQLYRSAFLWHNDTTRLSAMDYILHEMCAWNDL